MPYSARVTRVSASNGPKKPGEDGSATPNPISPCSRNAPTQGTGSPNARKHTANDRAFTTHSTTDQTTTPAKRAGLLRTASPWTSPSANCVTRSAEREGRTACSTRPRRLSAGAGRGTTTSATPRAVPNRAAAPPAVRDRGTPPTAASRGNDGAAIAIARRATMTRPSNTRSTPMEASAVVNRTGSWRRARYARATSPARAGSRLFAMKPAAVACHKGPSGKASPVPVSRRIRRQRTARSGNVAVAIAMAAPKSRGSARRRWSSTACGSTPCKAHASSRTVTASPSQKAQRDATRPLGAGLEGEGNEIADFVDEGAERIARRVPRLRTELLGAGQGALTAVHQRADVHHQWLGRCGRPGGGGGTGGVARWRAQ